MVSFGSLHEVFRADDGSLPEIRVEGMSRVGIEHALDLIASLAVAKPKFAHPLGPKAPEGVNHFVVSLEINGQALPELGVAAFSDALVFDYRMGPEWTDDRIRSLFHLLRRISEADKGAYVEIEREAAPGLRRAFQKAWMQYLTEEPAG